MEKAVDTYSDMLQSRTVAYDLSLPKLALAQSYATIAEAKLIGIISGGQGQNRRSLVEVELTKVQKFSRSCGHKIKEFMHASIVQEADAILVDG